MELDMKGFEKSMSGQKERSREDATVEAGDWTVIRDDEGTEFTGYEKTEDDIHISRYRTVKIKGKERYHLIFNKTPFYAESGGQIGDSGTISSGNEKVNITDTIKENNLVLHIAENLPSDPRAKMRATVDIERRMLTANNHTATHLLHHALRKVLGTHVEQKGSLVTPERLRFDFSHFARISKEELEKIEKIVNEMIRQNIDRNVIDGVSFDEAKNMGAMALFGEKYGDRVRVVGFGSSIELCGGTHVERTGNIGMLKIVSESAIAAGIRRIEAVTAQKAEDYINSRLSSVDEIASMLKSTGDIKENVEKLLSENTALKKTIEKFRAEAAINTRKALESSSVIINDFRFIKGIIEAESAEILKNIAHQIRNSGDDIVMILGAEIDGKANLLVMISDRLVNEKRFNAINIIKEIAGKIEGGGGGQPFLATAGGRKPSGLQEAVDKAEQIILGK
jgi:alanyl-tRNA synthetase